MLVCQALLSKVGPHAKQSFSGRHYQAELGSELNGEQLEATSGHPFYIQGKGWNAAANLKVGDALLLYNGTMVVVETVDFRVGRERVYNFSVAQNANYFVGSGGVGVHNCTLTKEEREALQAIADKYGVEIDVVGSRAAGKGRNINTNLPVGKDIGTTRSDIDVRVDGQAVIDSRGALADDLKNIGDDPKLVNVLFKHGDSYPPVIKIIPRR